MPRTPKCLYPGMTGPWVNDAENPATTTTTTPSLPTPLPSSSKPSTPATAGPTATAQTLAEADTNGETTTPQLDTVAVRAETPPVPDDSAAATEGIVNIEELRRCVAKTNAKLVNDIRLQLKHLMEEIRTSLESDRLKRKAELDEFFEKLERERDEDRRIQQQRHAETQAMLHRLEDSLEAIRRQQEIAMGNGRNRRTPNLQTSAADEDILNDTGTPKKDQ